MAARANGSSPEKKALSGSQEKSSQPVAIGMSKAEAIDFLVTVIRTPDSEVTIDHPACAGVSELGTPLIFGEAKAKRMLARMIGRSAAKKIDVETTGGLTLPLSKEGESRIIME